MTDPFQAYLDADQALERAAERLRQDAPAALRRLRVRGGWTLREMADLLSCDFTTLSKIEHGHIVPGKPLLSKLVRLAATLD